MARVTPEKSAMTRKKIIDAAFEITMAGGFELATFTEIARVAGVSRSGINAHYKRKTDIAAELAPIYRRIINSALVFDSCETFYESWVKAFNENAQFRAAITTAGPIISSADGLRGLFNLIQGEREEIERCVYMAVGYSVINATGRNG